MHKPRKTDEKKKIRYSLPKKEAVVPPRPYNGVNLLKRKIDIKLKKKVMLYRKTLDEQPIALTQLAMKSVVNKQIKLDGAPIEVEVMLYKAVKQAETETVKVKKNKVKAIPPPFRTLEE